MDDFVIRHNALVSAEEYDETLADMMQPEEVFHCLVDFMDGGQTLYSFSSEKLMHAFMETKQGDVRIARIGVIMNYMNYTDADNHLFTVH